MVHEKKGEKSKEPMGTNTQEGPTMQESADDWVWIAVLHQLVDSTDIQKTLISVFFSFSLQAHQLPEFQSGEIFIRVVILA